MKGFKLDKTGDVSITDGMIDMVSDIELEKQTIGTVLRTNKGESPFNDNEGIDFGQIRGKGVTEDMVKTQLQSGLRQVNRERIIEKFDYTVKDRHSTANFVARRSDGSSIEIESELS